ncbi:LysR family transcriptional regulator [Duganella sp. BuS-21]|uniref:LysR family transcriptional regulator n=1 Tax=Duganella sp. BuS-21 TaxID=2943848 RepID=UPI0035A6D98C
MDQLHLMTMFICVGEEERFAAAARRPDLSPAAVTRHLRAGAASGRETAVAHHP